MITLNNFTKLDNNQYQMVLSMKKTDFVDDLPSETRPMSPEYFAVTVDYGAPADGSIVIKEGSDILSYSAGRWGEAGTAGDIKLKELSVEENGEYLPESGYVGFNKVVVDVKKEMPVKGDLITLDGKQYRVLKINNSVAEVLSMADANSNQTFNTNNSNTYNGSDLDTYLNITWYSALSSAMKTAIVAKTISQESYQFSDSDPGDATYSYKYSFKSTDIDYAIQKDSALVGPRNVYTLNLSDIFIYQESNYIDCADLMQLWFNQSTATSSKSYIWLCSKNVANDKYCYIVNGELGGINTNLIEANREFIARPAFQIDLSKIDWTKSE